MPKHHRRKRPKIKLSKRRRIKTIGNEEEDFYFILECKSAVRENIFQKYTSF